jgi:hypothetical protein
LSACQPPPPRSYSEYLEDDVAREATLQRCNSDRATSFGDLECKHARRAAAALAAQVEAAQRAELERESDRKRAAARERIAAQQEATRRAAEAAEAAHEDELLYGGTKLDPLPPPEDAMRDIQDDQNSVAIDAQSNARPPEGAAVAADRQDALPLAAPVIALPPKPAAVMPVEPNPGQSEPPPASEAAAQPDAS